MFNFSVAHYYYIKSVRSQTFLGDNLVLSVGLAILLYGASCAIYVTLLMPGLEDPLLSVGVPVYILWLATTVSHQVTAGSLYHVPLKVWRSGVGRHWTMFLGAVFFMVSDSIIGINMFYAPVPHHQVTSGAGHIQLNTF